MPACLSCNRDKGNLTIDEYRAVLELRRSLEAPIHGAPNSRLADRSPASCCRDCKHPSPLSFGLRHVFAGESLRARLFPS